MESQPRTDWDAQLQNRLSVKWLLGAGCLVAGLCRCGRERLGHLSTSGFGIAESLRRFVSLSSALSGLLRRLLCERRFRSGLFSCLLGSHRGMFLYRLDQGTREGLMGVQFLGFTRAEHGHQFVSAQSQCACTGEIHKNEIGIFSERACQSQSAESLRLLDVIPLAGFDAFFAELLRSDGPPDGSGLTVQRDGLARPRVLTGRLSEEKVFYCRSRALSAIIRKADLLQDGFDLTGQLIGRYAGWIGSAISGRGVDEGIDKACRDRDVTLPQLTLDASILNHVRCSLEPIATDQGRQR